MGPVEGVAELNLGQIITALFNYGCRIDLNDMAKRTGRVGVSVLLRFPGKMRGSLRQVRR